MRGRLGLLTLVTAAATAALVGLPGAADEAWRYGQSPMAGSRSSAHLVRYVGPRERGFSLEIDCDLGQHPTVHIGVDAPGRDLRQIKFDVPVPVTVTSGAQVVRGSGLLTEGVSPHVDRIRVSVGMQDAVAIAQALARDPAPRARSPYAVVQIGRTSAKFALAGASQAIAELMRSCPAWPR